jgi:hypothetical protein
MTTDDLVFLFICGLFLGLVLAERRRQRYWHEYRNRRGRR